MRKKTKFKKELKEKQDILRKLLPIFNDEGNESLGTIIEEEEDDDENSIKQY